MNNYFALYKGDDIITHGTLMFIKDQTDRSIRELLKFRFKNRENYKLILVDEIEDDEDDNQNEPTRI